MNPFTERLREDRRLLLLRLLSEQNAYRSNASILHTTLYALGVAASRDDVRTDLAWLAEQGLVRVDEMAAHVDVATLTARGHDVVVGTAHAPGVSRPEPR